MTEFAFPYSYKFNASRIVDHDQQVVVEPGDNDLEAISRSFDLNGIERLRAVFTLKPYRKAGIRVKGDIQIDLEQTCVVTLEPFSGRLEIDVDRTFEPHSSRPGKVRDLNEDGEIEVQLESLDPPDVIADGVVDLGNLICEEMALALDPFPRKPGAEFEGGDPPGDDAIALEDEKPSPFAALEALKDRKNK